MTAEEIARLILEWEKVDDEVAELGWGGDRDERWDNAKGAMVSAAVGILGKENGK